MILGEVQDLPKGLERENRIIQTIMRQVLFALDGLHSTGIVHRDIKPQNVIFSEGKTNKHIVRICIFLVVFCKFDDNSGQSFSKITRSSHFQDY